MNLFIFENLSFLISLFFFLFFFFLGGGGQGPPPSLACGRYGYGNIKLKYNESDLL